MKSAKSVEEYIARAPEAAQSKLRQVRAAILQVAPAAVESISYGMPAYDKGQIAWFGLVKSHVGLYLRPPIVDEHKKELAGYGTTKSAVQLPLNKTMPVALIKKLVRARMARNKAASEG
jgi:uncharacterized protein YdhG (YjbR/CyaY superfamily)